MLVAVRAPYATIQVRARKVNPGCTVEQNVPPLSYRWRLLLIHDHIHVPSFSQDLYMNILSLTLHYQVD